MKRTISSVFLLFVLLSVFRTLAFAHPGKTDSAGGHYDASTGEYHYHHGYSAHQHNDIDNDGIPDCPYEYDDKTGQNSGPPAWGSSIKVPVHSETIPPKYITTIKEEEIPMEVMPQWAKYIIFILAVACFILLILNRLKSKDISDLNKRLDTAQKDFDSEVRKSSSLSTALEIMKLERENAKLALKMAKENSEKEIEKERKLRLDMYRETLDDALKEKIKQDIGENYLLTLADAPSRIEFDIDGLPHKYENGDDLFTFSVSDSGKYHRSSCRYGKSGRTVHAIEISNDQYRYSACNICRPLLPDLSWFSKYKQYEKQLESSNYNWKDCL